MDYLIDLNRPETLRVMSQTGVRQYVFPGGSHPACWDAIQLDDGNILLSLCSELTTGEYAKLALYDPARNEARELASLRTSQFLSDRWIRPSKVHTSMCRMDDGRIIMVTHTTDKAPQHPAWMPGAYFADPWEGFPGSSMLIYDPASGKLEDLGVPAPRETLYGGVWNRATGTYFALGFLKGELYEIDPVSHAVRNHGQAVERASYRLAVGSDDNVYFTTRNGVLERFNIAAGRVERVGYQMPAVREPGRLPPYFCYALSGPDGKLWMAGMSDMRLSAYDPATGKASVFGRFLDEERYSTEPGARPYVGCMGFDQEDVLWACICTVRKGGAEDYKLPALLVRGDVMRGGEPEILGIAGTPERVVTTVCTMLMDRARDRMYLFGSNHGCDGPDVESIDLAAFRPMAKEPGPCTRDALIRPGNGLYRAHGEQLKRGGEIRAENSTMFRLGRVTAVPLWTRFSSEEQEESSVRSLRFVGDELEALCGKTRGTRFRITAQGAVVSRESAPIPDAQAAPEAVNGLPYYPGRQYKRAAALCVPISGRRTLAATEDGLLSIVSGENVYALGPGWVNGPVRSLAATPDGSAVWGVAGDDEDICVVFSYDDRAGLRWRGTVSAVDPTAGVCSSPRLDAVAVSDDGRQVAVGAGGRMGCVYLYQKEDAE